MTMRSSFLVLLLVSAAFLLLGASCDDGAGDQQPPVSLNDLRPGLTPWMREFLSQTTVDGLLKLIQRPAFTDVDEEYAMAVLSDPNVAPQEAYNIMTWTRVLGTDMLAFQAVEYFVSYFKHMDDPSPLEEALAAAAIRSSYDLLRISPEVIVTDELRQRLWKAVWDALEADGCGGYVSARAAHTLATVVPGLLSDYDRPLVDQQQPFAQSLLDNDMCSDVVMNNAAYMVKMLKLDRENLDRWQAQGVFPDISVARYRDLIIGGSLFDDRFATAQQDCENEANWETNPFCVFNRAYQHSEFAAERVVHPSKMVFPPIPDLADVLAFSSRAFRQADSDGNRALSVPEFAAFMGDRCSQKSIRSAIQTVYAGTRQSVERSMFFVVANTCMNETSTSSQAIDAKSEL